MMSIGVPFPGSRRSPPSARWTWGSCRGLPAVFPLAEISKFDTQSCSASLSSVDSEESLRAAERLHNRQSRNSAGGISTHSLNEAELVVSGIRCCFSFVVIRTILLLVLVVALQGFDSSVVVGA